jgi:two-component system response regulator FlrC
MSKDNQAPILVVDDDRDVRDAICDTLSDAGYAVTTADDGVSALSYIGANPAPSLILLDWNMPAMNAQQFMAAFEATPLSAQVPVVLVTADGHIERKVKAANFRHGIKKPVDLDELFQVVEQFTSQRSS